MPLVACGSGSTPHVWVNGCRNGPSDWRSTGAVRLPMKLSFDRSNGQTHVSAVRSSFQRLLSLLLAEADLQLGCSVSKAVLLSSGLPVGARSAPQEPTDV